MAGIGRPGMLGQLVRTIKEKHPDVLIQYHGHSGPGLSMASILEVCENGADIIDVAMEPMSWGKVHPDIISVQAMLKDLGFQVPDINMKAYMKARAMTQEFIDEFLGYFMDPTNKHMSSLLLKCGLPGGMMGSMMADLKGVHSGINMILRGNNERHAVRRSGICMAQAGLSSFGDSFQPVCEECGFDEPHAAGKGRGALDDDRQPYVGHDSGQERTPPRYFSARDSGTGQVQRL